MADLHLWILTPWEAGFLRSNCAHNVDRPVTPMISIWKNMSLKGEQKTAGLLRAFCWRRRGAALGGGQVPISLRSAPYRTF